MRLDLCEHGWKKSDKPPCPWCKHSNTYPRKSRKYQPKGCPIDEVLLGEYIEATYGWTSKSHARPMAIADWKAGDVHAWDLARSTTLEVQERLI